MTFPSHFLEYSAYCYCEKFFNFRHQVAQIEGEDNFCQSPTITIDWMQQWSRVWVNKLNFMLYFSRFFRFKAVHIDIIRSRLRPSGALIWISITNRCIMLFSDLHVNSASAVPNMNWEWNEYTFSSQEYCWTSAREALEFIAAWQHTRWFDK